MSVRKREWLTSKGEHKEAWIVDYMDQRGKRHIETFRLKKDADARENEIGVNVREGTHVANSTSITIKEAGDDWIKTVESVYDPPLEQTTIDQYKQHLRLHIEPYIGAEKLSRITVPFIRKFEDKLRSEGRSGTMVAYVIRSLGALLADAQERGNIVRNPVSELRRNRRKRNKASNGKDKRGHALEVGIDIPTPDEIRAIISAAEKSRYKLLIITAIFTGMRASELRGLSWKNVDFDKKEIRVRQRADRFNKIGPPKTKAGHREIPLPPNLLHDLKKWKLKCPKGEFDLVFPNSEGNVEWHTNLILRGLHPILLDAKVTRPAITNGKPARDKNGKPIVEPKYSGLHALRHFFASWCADQELSPKQVQKLMGHSNIAVTMDTYTKVFPADDSVAGRLKEAENALLG